MKDFMVSQCGQFIQNLFKAANKATIDIYYSSRCMASVQIHYEMNVIQINHAR